jgi:glycosyltransferase involved in cell wall biosynthesis
MKKLPISVCLVSGAEAHRIRGTLESVAGWTSEIVVVLNSEVTDGTDRIATDFGAKVFREDWKGFGRQKNSAAAKAGQPWILSLDADEVVPPPLQAEIARTLDDPARNHRYAAFAFPRCTFYCGRWIRHGDWYPDRVTRLWRRGQAAWEGVEPHPYLRAQGAIGRLASDLQHFSNESIDRQIAKIAPYSDGFVQHCRQRGRQAGFLDLAVRPIWRFLRAYVFRLGFLDGWPGYYIACLSAFSTVTRYVKVREAALRAADSQAAASPTP